MCSRVPPAPVYTGGEGEAGQPLQSAPGEGVLLGHQVIVGFHLEEGGRRKGEGEGKERGAPPLPLVQFGPKGGGGRPAPPGPSSLPNKAHRGPLVPPGGSGNPLAL